MPICETETSRFFKLTITFTFNMRFSKVLMGLVSTAAALPSLSTVKNNTPKIFRRPDSSWDYIVQTNDESTEALSSRTSNYLAEYTLRGKEVDPSSLGVDTVKQYSGYLDDNDKDKHLFYC